MVLDQHRNGIPVAWALHERSTEVDFACWLVKLKERTRAAQADWCPSCVMVDDCDAELNALK